MMPHNPNLTSQTLMRTILDNGLEIDSSHSCALSRFDKSLRREIEDPRQQNLSVPQLPVAKSEMLTPEGNKSLEIIAHDSTQGSSKNPSPQDLCGSRGAESCARAGRPGITARFTSWTSPEIATLTAHCSGLRRQPRRQKHGLVLQGIPAVGVLPKLAGTAAFGFPLREVGVWPTMLVVQLWFETSPLQPPHPPSASSALGSGLGLTSNRGPQLLSRVEHPKPPPPIASACGKTEAAICCTRFGSNSPPAKSDLPRSECVTQSRTRAWMEGTFPL